MYDIYYNTIEHSYTCIDVFIDTYTEGHSWHFSCRGDTH